MLQACDDGLRQLQTGLVKTRKIAFSGAALMKIRFYAQVLPAGWLGR